MTTKKKRTQPSEKKFREQCYGHSSGIRVDPVSQEPMNPLPAQPPGPKMGPDGKPIYRVVVVETITHELSLACELGEAREKAKAILNLHHETTGTPDKVRERTVVVQHII
jgi:hypothetical protein